MHCALKNVLRDLFCEQGVKRNTIVKQTYKVVNKLRKENKHSFVLNFFSNKANSFLVVL